MSYSPGAYVPPPPPSAVKRGKSPWFFVGMGCLGLVLLTLGLIGYSAFKVMDAMKQPATSLGDVPIYPKAKLDVPMTKVVQGTAAVTRMITGKQSFAASVYRVSVTPEAAVTWYDTEMTKRGYVPTKARQSSIGQKMEGQVMHQYFKKEQKEIVMVQAGIAPDNKADKTDTADTTMLIVMRMMGAGARSGGKGFVPDAPASAPK